MGLVRIVGGGLRLILCVLGRLFAIVGAGILMAMMLYYCLSLFIYYLHSSIYYYYFYLFSSILNK